ncbi:MAG: ATP-binding protein, partial [Methylobacter sp.]|nr:ATP-binding protein [Methylobacter sp.]
QVSFDNAHTLSLLQTDYRKLTEQHKTLRKDLVVLVRLLKQLLARFPGTHPYRYYARVEDELGIDSDEMAWLNRIQVWYATEADTARSWLMSQAKLFGSAIRNYQQALERFDRGIDSLSRRLTANIDGNIRFEKIERIEGRLTSKVTTLGYWEQIVSFTRNYDDWSRTNGGQLPSQEFADIVRLVSEQLKGKGRVEMKLVNLLELEIIVTENGRSKRATHAEDLRQISSHGLSYLILCVFFIALVNMIRKDQPLNIIWPMDELKELHQMNIEVLVEMLTKNRITLFSAFPDPDPEVLRLFKNRYQVFGYRELIEMDVDEDYLSTIEPLTAAEHV